MSRRSVHRVDTTQAAIVKALRGCGCSVLSLTSVGAGCPDLLVARAGRMWLFEVKSPGGELRASQRDWVERWRAPVHVVETPERALAVVWTPENETGPG